MTDSNPIIDKFFGDASTPIEWESDEEKGLHFWVDDLHCPQPITPMWYDVGGWWLTCDYMYRRFGVPFGKDWVAKRINEYVMSAVVPRDPAEAEKLGAYFGMVMPVYADNFLYWWKNRFVPEILRNFEFLDNFPMDTASLPELMVLLEDALDIQERHFRLHWVLNLAQFQSAMGFQGVLGEVVGEVNAELVGRVLVSDEDRNWDSIKALWEIKEGIKGSAAIKDAFQNDTPKAVMKALEGSEDGKKLLAQIDDYKMEYGNKAIYTHEYIFTTWRENPAPIVEALRGYLDTDYSYPTAVEKLKKGRDAAIVELWESVPDNASDEQKKTLEDAMKLAIDMVPLTPDHHFYMDQGTYARLRLVFMAIGRKLVEADVLSQADDVLFLIYDELRPLSANHQLFDAKKLTAERRQVREDAYKKRPPLWAGTITEWSLNGEPYKGLWNWPEIYNRSKEAVDTPADTVRGLGASAGVIEGPARVVHTPDEFDQVKKGDIVVCIMTNPAWVVIFTKIAGLVTDAGGALAHPAVISREFGIPAVVGTGNATERIKTGQRIRVNGAAGVVEILG